jgi:hypothetical protein
MKGNKILHTSKKSGYYTWEINYVFEEPMYDIEIQDVSIKIFSSRKDIPLAVYTFSINLDNKDIVGWVD